MSIPTARPPSSFLSTLSLRRATLPCCKPTKLTPSFLSTLSLRRATDTTSGPHLPRRFLSTLSLRRATLADMARRIATAFLSTLSLRRATRVHKTRRKEMQYFYPRSPCGERLIMSENLTTTSIISIHALLAESDLTSGSPASCRIRFLSTLSLRRAT